MKPHVQYLLECYMEDKIIQGSESHERSSDIVYQQSSTGKESLIQDMTKVNSLVMNFGDGLIQMADNQEANARIYASLNARQRQQIRVLARNLRTSADSMQIRPPKSLLAVEKAILQTEGLNEEEMQVLNNIHAIKTNTTITQIADYLGEKLTSRTFKAALRFVCYSASSVPEELAIVCELAKVICPKIKVLSYQDSIYDAFSEFIEDKLDSVIQ